MHLTLSTTQPRAIDAPRPGRDRGSSRGALPREIRTSSLSSTPQAEAQRARGVHSTPPPGRKNQAGGGSGADFTRPHRRGFGGSESVAESSLLNSLLRQNGGSSLPLPSRKGANNSVRSGDGGSGNGTGGDTGRWANPAPRGRRQRDTSASGSGSYAAMTYSYPGGSAEIRGSGVPARASRASGEANSSSALSHRPQSSGGSGPRSNRAGGAQTYRSGSPAPGRSRRSSAAAAAAAAAVTSAAAGVSDSSSRYTRQQATHEVHKPRQHRSGIPPGFRGYIMQSGSSSGADGVSYEATNAQRSHHAPSTTSRDRGRRMGRDVAGRQGGVAAAPKAGAMGVVPRSFAIAANRSFGRRPSTTEGLTGDSIAGRRGRSSSPAPRPSSGESLLFFRVWIDCLFRACLLRLVVFFSVFKQVALRCLEDEARDECSRVRCRILSCQALVWVVAGGMREHHSTDCWGRKRRYFDGRGVCSISCMTIAVLPWTLASLQGRDEACRVFTDQEDFASCTKRVAKRDVFDESHEGWAASY